jgi:hypothetical protein
MRKRRAGCREYYEGLKEAMFAHFLTTEQGLRQLARPSENKIAALVADIVIASHSLEVSRQYPVDHILAVS